MGSAKPDIAFLPELDDYAPPVFYRSLDEIEQAPAHLPYLHAMRQAWRLLRLDGIFCVQNRPTIYFKEAKRSDPERIQMLHRKLWNQGTATLLLVILPAEIQVYSGLVPPSKPDDSVARDGRLVDTLERTAGALELRSLIRQVETGFFYAQHLDSFRADQAVDHFLLENLRAVRDELLVDDWSHRAVHTLLGRIIFVCYLVDRGIISANHFERAGGDGIKRLGELFSLSDVKVRHVLAKLFKDLQAKFNGSMFVDGDHADANKLSSDQIACLCRFLQGEEIKKKQRTLGFWGYDFSVIPVETISAIYEEFLAAEDPNGRKSSGAFYTKRHLAEFVVDTALEGVTQLHRKKCLDPACGSGIFLVILFSRMAESWRRENPGVQNVTRTRALIDILKNQLCGVDKMETACRITCFSLYLTLLDQLNPPDIDELYIKHGAVLPDILALAANSYQARDGRVVVEGNFFDATLPIAHDFDLVIGNPPWVSRGGAEMEAAPTNWYSSGGNPHLADAPQGKTARRAWFMPNGELAIPFLWKAPVHLNDAGNACLLVPSKILLNDKTNLFQSHWFSRHTVRQVVQLADLRRILFANALCPATIVLLGRDVGEAKPPVSFLAPKVSREDPRPDAITISPEDVKSIDVDSIQRHALADRAPMLWKKFLWATPRDMKFLDYLSSYPPLSDIVGKPKEKKRWVQGQGFQPWKRESFKRNPSTYPKRIEISWKADRLYLDAGSKEMGLVLTKGKCRHVGHEFRDGLRRSPDQNIFLGPKVLFNQGFTNFAYCDFSVLFQHSLQSIAGPDGDKVLLKFLTAYLNSRLATYFLFHSAANWGTERDKVHLFEVMRLPFPLPEDFSTPATQFSILSTVEQVLDDYASGVENSPLINDSKFSETVDTLNGLVNAYFDLSDSEVMLVDDTVNVIEPSSTPSSKAGSIETLRTPNPTERIHYADTLCAALNDWAKRGPWRVSAAITLAQNQGMALVTLRKSKKATATSERVAPDALDSAIRRMRGVLREKRGGLHHLLDLKVFDGAEIHMLKRLELRSWTRTAALNDADEIAAAILTPRG